MILSLFEKVVKMSLDTSYIVIGILLIRTLLKKAPRVFSYVLWLVVFIRLICPFSFESVFSFYNYIPADEINEKIISTSSIKNVNHNTPIIANNSIISIRNSEEINVSNKSIGIEDILSYGWILGSLILLFYNILAYLKVKNKIRNSTIVVKNIYETDQIESAFVFGIINPKIYIPIGINEEEKNYILAHEKVHIKRKDYLIKYLAFFVLVIHWFNPFVWLSFMLMTKDMEMSCDEAALKNLGENCIKNYSLTLLKFATRNTLSQSLLSFGENSTKVRIKNVLKYKKPAIGIIVLCSILCLTVVVASTTNAVSKSIDNTSNLTNTSINLTNSPKDSMESINNDFNLSIINYLASRLTWLYYNDDDYWYMNFNLDGTFEIGESTAAYYETGNYTVNNYDITVNITRRHSNYINNSESVNETYKLYLNYKEESISIYDKPYVFLPRSSIDKIHPTAFDNGTDNLTIGYLLFPSWRCVDYNDHSKSLEKTLIFYGDGTCDIYDPIGNTFYKGNYIIDGNNVSIKITSSIDDGSNYQTKTLENKSYELAFNNQDESLYVKYMIENGVRVNNPFAFIAN